MKWVGGFFDMGNCDYLHAAFLAVVFSVGAVGCGARSGLDGAGSVDAKGNPQDAGARPMPSAGSDAGARPMPRPDAGQCRPDCLGRACGQSDGCGGTCTTGFCGSGLRCAGGVCMCDSSSCAGCCSAGQCNTG